MSAKTIGRIRARIAELNLRTYDDNASRAHSTVPPRDANSEHESDATIGRERPSQTIVVNAAFGAALRSIRTSRHLSQSRLGNAAEVSHSYVSRLESGTRQPTRAAVLALADALEATDAERSTLMVAAGYVCAAPSVDPLVAELDAMLRDETVCAGCRADVRQVVTMTLALARRRLEAA